MKKLKEITFHWEEIIFLFINFSQSMNLNMEMQKNVDEYDKLPYCSEDLNNEISWDPESGFLLSLVGIWIANIWIAETFE